MLGSSKRKQKVSLNKFTIRGSTLIKRLQNVTDGNFIKQPLKNTYCHNFFFFFSNAQYRHTLSDRQTDILLTEKKSHYRLICHRNERDICTCIYKIVSLLKSYDNIHGMTYTAKIMLSGIAKIKTGYFDNIYYYYKK